LRAIKCVSVSAKKLTEKENGTVEELLPNLGWLI
jgi:hypothetical protein